MTSSISGHESGPDASGRQSSRPPRLRVAIASDLSLVAEAVGAALAGPQLAVTLLSWPREPRDDPVRRQLERAAPDVGLLIYEVDAAARMDAAAALMQQWAGPWIVLAGDGPDITWGGLREAGAVAVRPSVIGLDELDELIRVAREGAGGAQPTRWTSTSRDGARHRPGTPSSASASRPFLRANAACSSCCVAASSSARSRRVTASRSQPCARRSAPSSASSTSAPSSPRWRCCARSRTATH